MSSAYVLEREQTAEGCLGACDRSDDLRRTPDGIARGGFITLIVITAILLFEFAIRGHRRYLLVLTALAAVVLWRSSSGMLLARLEGTFDTKENVASAYGSAQQREQLFWRSVEVTKEHPLFGVGPGNFQVISGDWHVTHNSFTQMSSEGGVPALIFYLLILWTGFKNLRKTKQLRRGRLRIWSVG